MKTPEVTEVSVKDSDSKKEYDKHEIESAAETLLKAEEIKENAELYKCCQEHMHKKSGHITNALGKKPESLAELKTIAKEKAKKEMMG